MKTGVNRPRDRERKNEGKRERENNDRARTSREKFLIHPCRRGQKWSLHFLNTASLTLSLRRESEAPSALRLPPFVARMLSLALSFSLPPLYLYLYTLFAVVVLLRASSFPTSLKFFIYTAGNNGACAAWARGCAIKGCHEYSYI